MIIIKLIISSKWETDFFETYMFTQKKYYKYKQMKKRDFCHRAYQFESNYFLAAGLETLALRILPSLEWTLMEAPWLAANWLAYSIASF